MNALLSIAFLLNIAVIFLVGVGSGLVLMLVGVLTDVLLNGGKCGHLGWGGERDAGGWYILS